MKILHTSDWHLGKIVNGYSMIEDQKYVLEQIKKILLDENCDCLLISGDVYDRRIPTFEAINLLDEFLTDVLLDYKKTVIIIPGNHDSIERLSFGKGLFSKTNLYIAGNVKESLERIRVDNTDFYLMPYVNLFTLKQTLKQDFKTMEEAYKYIVGNTNVDKSKFNVLLLHDYVTYNMEKLIESDSERNMSLGGIEFIDANVFTSFHYIALGHLHAAQKVREINIRYSGSILKYSFSEVNHKKSVTIVENTGSIRQIPLVPLRELVVVEATLDQALSYDFYSKYNYRTDYFKIVLKDDDVVIDAYSRLKAIYCNLMEISVENPKVTAKLETKRSVEDKTTIELFSSFYEYVTTNELQADDVKTIEMVMKNVNK